MAENADTLIRFLLPDAHTRGAIIRGTHIIEEAKSMHGLSDMPAQMLGKTLLASILLLTASKGGVRQVLQLDALPSQSQAPIRRILAEAKTGSVRGYLNWKEGAAIQRNPQEEGISAWMGHPLHISAVRDLGFGTPYISTIEYDSEYLADHIVHFLHQSAQIRADMILQDDIAILLEAMPGCDDEHWFKAVSTMAGISNDDLKHQQPEQLLQAFDALHVKIVGHDDYIYQCDCNAEKLSAALLAITIDNLPELADEHGNLTVSCQYCSNHYSVPLQDFMDKQNKKDSSS